MVSDLFPSLPDEARLWAYVSDRPIDEQEQRQLLDTLASFFETWSSHGRPVHGSARLVDDRLLLVGAVVRGDDISGCGIDSSVNVIEETAQDLDVQWMSPLHVFYRTPEGQIEAVSRGQFRDLAQQGVVTTETPVIDVSVESVGALREGQLQQPAGQAWHGRAFSLASPEPQ